MSSMRRLDTEKLRTRRIVATATLTVFMIAFLLLRETSAAVSATPGAGPSYQAAGERFPSDPAEAEQMPAGQTPKEAAAQDHDPGGSAGENAVQTASTPRPVRPQEQ